MPIPSVILALPSWTAIAVAAGVVAIVRDQWQERQARTVVEHWAARHQYRLLRCRRRWLSLAFMDTRPRYGVLGGEHERHAYAFAVEVVDRALGGVSRGRVAVRGSWIGGFEEEEVDVAWDALNTADPAAPPAGPSWDAAQLALLDRVAAGESAFRPDDPRSAGAGERFDLLVEHLHALQRRGLVDFPAPIADTGGTARQYAAVTNVALTAAGRALLKR